MWHSTWLHTFGPLSFLCHLVRTSIVVSIHIHWPNMLPRESDGNSLARSYLTARTDKQKRKNSLSFENLRKRFDNEVKKKSWIGENVDVNEFVFHLFFCLIWNTFNVHSLGRVRTDGFVFISKGGRHLIRFISLSKCDWDGNFKTRKNAFFWYLILVLTTASINLSA